MHKRYFSFYTCLLLLFVVLYLLLSFYSRLATDDYYFIWDVKTHGIVTGVTSQYMAWCGRFAATFFMDVFYAWFGVHQSYYLLLPVFSLVLLVTGIYYCLKNVFVYLNIHATPFQKTVLSFSLVALLFFLSIDIGESWFWYCAMSSYLWSIIAFVWGIAFVFQMRYFFISAFFAMLCFIYVGGSSEVYAVLFGILLSLFIGYQYKKAGNFKLFYALSINKKMSWIYVALAISFLIFLIAPGNYLRDGLFPKHQFFYSFFITAKSIVKFSALYFPFRIPAIIAFATPYFIFGNHIRSEKEFAISFRLFFYRITFLFCSLLFIFFFVVAFVMVETGPPRLWFVVSFLFSIYCAALFFYAGNKQLLNLKNSSLLQNMGLVIGFLLLTYHLITQYPIATKYALANEQRIQYIVALNETQLTDTIISLTPLPPAGMLYSTEIALDTNHFTNKELRLGYQLKFHVVKEK
jgi:Family of unknown function (DUF6056)